MNKFLLICFLVPSVAAWSADGVSPAAQPENLRVDVRVDGRTGRLVRRVTVMPKVIAPTVVKTSAPAPRAKDIKYGELVEQAAKQYEVDPLLVHAVIQVESNYNPHAVSPVGAQGLMQLMPGTAKMLGVHNAFDAEENIRAGVKHLKDLQKQYKDDRLALAAYNAGAGAVNRYQWIPPFKETQEYVYRVGKKYGEARRAAAASTLVAPPPAEAEAPKEPEHRPVEAFLDSEGRLYMRTK